MSCRRTNTLLLAAMTTLAGMGLPARAAAPPATQTAGEAGTTAMTARVAEVQGNVRVRTGPDQPWQPATVGMEVNEGAEFRTGVRSSVRCIIPPDQEIIIDRLTTMRIAEAIKQGNTIKTDLTMKYGRTQYNIQAAGAQHEATIRSPSSTLAVRGTRVMMYDQPPFTPEARSFIGRAIYTDSKKQIAVGSPTRGARILSDRNTTAETALDETVVDPVYAAARTNSEAQFVAQETSRGGVVSFNERLGIDTVRNSAPLSDRELAAANLPGELNFVLRWAGNTDLDLTVTNQFGDPNQIFGIPPFPPLQEGDPGYKPTETLYPGFGLNTTPGGGRIPFNHLGGPQGGQEVASYTPARAGVYTFQVLNRGGQNADATFNIFLRRQAQGISGVPQVDAQGNVITRLEHINLGTPEAPDIIELELPALEGDFPLLDENGNQLRDEEGDLLFGNNPPLQFTRTVARGGEYNFSYFLYPAILAGEQPTTENPVVAAARRQGAPPINPTKAQRVQMKKEVQAQQRAAASVEAANKKAAQAASRAAAKEAKAQRVRSAKEARQVMKVEKAGR